MSIPLITMFRSRVELLMQAETILNTVLMHPPDTVDSEVFQLPICGLFFFHQLTEDRNRLELDSYLLHIEVVHQEDEGRSAVLDQGELIEATLHNALYTDLKDGILKGYGIKVSKNPFTNQYEDENIGRIIMQYNIVIPHKFGDGFTKTNY